MRLCMFHPLDQPLKRGWVGRVDGDHVTWLAAQTLQSFFTGGAAAREHAIYRLEGVRLLAPVLHPPAVRVFEEQGSFAFVNPAAIVGPSATIRGTDLHLLPRLTAVIGDAGAIGGFTALAEWRRADRSPPKDRDFALGLGPLVVTTDELDAEGLEGVVRIDGTECLRGRFDGFDWAAARDLAAEGTTLYAGDLLAGPTLGSLDVGTGTSLELDVEGVGALVQAVSRD
jgi:hypothetical protein